ncbi:MAG: cupin domain-containing protein [Caulobacterales bacterium]
MAADRRSALTFLVLATILGACASGIYPALQEPYHKAVFQNSCINVYDVRLLPGQHSFFHIHTHDQLGIVLQDAEAFNQEFGADERLQQARAGSISYIPHSTSSGYTHRIRVTGQNAFRVIGVEFTKKAPPGAVAASAGPDQAPPLFAQGAITRVKLSPGAPLALERSLIIAETPSELAAGDKAWTLSAGAVRWVDKDTTASSKATSTLLILKLSDTAACAADPKQGKQ